MDPKPSVGATDVRFENEHRSRLCHDGNSISNDRRRRSLLYPGQGGAVARRIRFGLDLKAGSQRRAGIRLLAVRFPLTDRTVKTEIDWVKLEKNESHKEFIALHVRGFDMVDIWRRRQQVIYPFFTNESYRGSKVWWRKVVRFAPDDERGW